jgi:exopolysaccharide/PEP-CTERM locus tyrosine autokinase
MVTSSREGEGKTFVAINLAMSLAAERDKKVLLIDADLSDPSILKRLGIRAERGLIDVLDDASIDLADVLLRTNVEGLSVLPAGHPHPLSTELLASARMEQFMSEIAQRYVDRVIVLDAPPVLATSESAALALHVGQIAFVVEASRTSQSAVKEALGLISICPDIGFVLNKAPFQFGATRFGSYYKSYDKSYYRGKKKIKK